MKRDNFVGKIHGHFSPGFSALLLGVSARYCQIVPVDESEIIITRMGTNNRSEMVVVHGTLCAIPPLNIRLTAHYTDIILNILHCLRYA
jgi:hypothetical protein